MEYHRRSAAPEDEETRVHVARRMWSLYEPVHAVTYFAPQARALPMRPATAASG